MIVGLNLSHDSSAALVDASGQIIAAISEERLSRKKNHVSFPRLSLESLATSFDFKNIEKVIIGSHSNFRFAEMNSLHWLFETQNFPKFDGIFDKNTWPPGYSPAPQLNNSNDRDGSLRKKWLEKKIINEFYQYGVKPEIYFRNHHDAHVFSGIGSAQYKRGLAISLDGEGDGESGTVKQFWVENNFVRARDLARIPNTSSLGYLYSSVTSRYNFRSTFHEGKITGLASFGVGGEALDFLLSKIQVLEGIPHFKIPKSRVTRLIFEIIQRATKANKFIYSLENLASIAAEKSHNYADLAAAIQDVLEISVVEMISHFINLTGERNITLAGGVFANVKLNQKISEMKDVDSVSIFPAMGDGGLAIGGAWDYLHSIGMLSNNKKYDSMYLDYTSEKDLSKSLIDYEDNKNLDIKSEEIHGEAMVAKVANLIAEGQIIGLVYGAMEFGPRALMHRSILADPRNPRINEILNKRLKRTEFMPFAPVCAFQDLGELFEIERFGDLNPFLYMTITCKVRQDWRTAIPAVVHVDGTARPQVLPKDDETFPSKILAQFKKISGIPCLINTSFNIHEEPIVRSLEDAIRALRSGAVDYLVTEDRIFRLTSFVDI